MQNASHARSGPLLAYSIAVCLAILSSRAQAREANQVLISGYPYRYQNTGEGELYNKRGKLIVRLDDLFLGMVQLDKVVGNELFWIAGPVQNENNSGYKFELRVTDLKSKKTRSLWSDDHLKFKVNKNGSIIAVSHDSYESGTEGLSGRSKITIIDRKKNRKREIFDEPLAVFGLNDPFCWSSDNSMMWAGYGLGDIYDELILYRNGQVRTFDQEFGPDFIIDCDRGWIASSDYPHDHAPDQPEGSLGPKAKMTLWLYDVLKQKRVQVASTAASEDGFHQKWKKTSSGTPKLVYYIGHRKHVADPARLLKSRNAIRTRQYTH
jgi:hypothetical protein